MAQTDQPHCKDKGVEISVQNDTESAQEVCRQINLKRDDCYYGDWEFRTDYLDRAENNVIKHFRLKCYSWTYKSHGGHPCATSRTIQFTNWIQWNMSHLVSDIQDAEDYCNHTYGSFFVMETSTRFMSFGGIVKNQPNTLFLGARYNSTSQRWTGRTEGTVNQFDFEGFYSRATLGGGNCSCISNKLKLFSCPCSGSTLRSFACQAIHGVRDKPDWLSVKKTYECDYDTTKDL
ncbi:uncharacterized protein LOC142354035 [Convolutriloba macropyga]|uniref:uncharacterized protein LOC142354035 n=1 Tax=Convolutriloba macropyga TaxID=536237 RepID=UPI003F51FA26